MDGMPWRLPEQAAVQDALRRRMPSGVQDTLYRPERPAAMRDALHRERSQRPAPSLDELAEWFRGRQAEGPSGRIRGVEGDMRRPGSGVPSSPRATGGRARPEVPERLRETLEQGRARRPGRGEPGGSFEAFRDIIMQQRQQPRPRPMPDEGRLAEVAGRLRERR